MKMLSRFATVSTLVLGVLAGPSFASAQTPAITVDIIGGKVLAKGAGVLVTLEVTCEVLSPPATYTYVSANIIERSGNKFANGYGYSYEFACSDTTQPQKAEILVRAESVRFKAGDAIAEAYIEQCNEAECNSGNTRSVIRLSN